MLWRKVNLFMSCARCSRVILFEQGLWSHCGAFKPYPFCETVICVCSLCQAKVCFPSLICSYTHAQTTVFNSPVLFSPCAHSPLSTRVPVLSRINLKPSHLLISPQHPLPGPMPYLELPHSSFSQVAERSPLHLLFIIVFSLTFLSLPLCT